MGFNREMGMRGAYISIPRYEDLVPKQIGPTGLNRLTDILDCALNLLPGDTELFRYHDTSLTNCRQVLARIRKGKSHFNEHLRESRVFEKAIIGIYNLNSLSSPILREAINNLEQEEKKNILSDVFIDEQTLLNVIFGEYTNDNSQAQSAIRLNPLQIKALIRLQRRYIEKINDENFTSARLPGNWTEQILHRDAKVNANKRGREKRDVDQRQINIRHTISGTFMRAYQYQMSKSDGASREKKAELIDDAHYMLRRRKKQDLISDSVAKKFMRRSSHVSQEDWNYFDRERTKPVSKRKELVRSASIFKWLGE